MQKILIIDDSKELLEMIEFILRLHGYDVKTASSKSDALYHLLHFEPGVILMDVRLNHVDGRRFCKEIKLSHTGKPLAIFLLSASPELLLDYENFLADGIVEKPFDIDTILNKISAVAMNPFLPCVN